MPPTVMALLRLALVSAAGPCPAPGHAPQQSAPPDGSKRRAAWATYQLPERLPGPRKPSATRPVSAIRAGRRARLGGSAFREVPPTQLRCPAAQLQCPAAQLRCPVAQLQCPVAQLQCPVAQPRCPVAQLQCPAAQLRCPAAQLRCPAAQLRCPVAQLRCPAAQLRCRVAQLRCPVAQDPGTSVPQNAGGSTRSRKPVGARFSRHHPLQSWRSTDLKTALCQPQSDRHSQLVPGWSESRH